MNKNDIKLIIVILVIVGILILIINLNKKEGDTVEVYYKDDVLLSAFIQNVEYSIRAGDPKYSFLKYDLKFLLSIQNNNSKTNKYMETVESKSYQIGLRTGKLSKPLKKAINSFEKALAIEPDDSDTHNNLGVALMKSGNIKKALDHFEEARKLNPRSNEVKNNISIAIREMANTTRPLHQ